MAMPYKEHGLLAALTLLVATWGLVCCDAKFTKVHTIEFPKKDFLMPSQAFYWNSTLYAILDVIEPFPSVNNRPKLIRFDANFNVTGSVELFAQTESTHTYFEPYIIDSTAYFFLEASGQTQFLAVDLVTLEITATLNANGTGYGSLIPVANEPALYLVSYHLKGFNQQFVPGISKISLAPENLDVTQPPFYLDHYKGLQWGLSSQRDPSMVYLVVEQQNETFEFAELSVASNYSTINISPVNWQFGLYDDIQDRLVAVSNNGDANIYLWNQVSNSWQIPKVVLTFSNQQATDLRTDGHFYFLSTVNDSYSGSTVHQLSLALDGTALSEIGTIYIEAGAYFIFDVGIPTSYSSGGSASIGQVAFLAEGSKHYYFHALVVLWYDEE